MAMILTKYGKTKEYDKPLYKNPTSTEEIFSVKGIDPTGIFVLPNDQYSKMYILTDINFAGVTDAEQKRIIINFSKVLNSMTCRFSYTVADEYVAEEDFNNRILYKIRDDESDYLRNEFNQVIKEKLTDAKQGLYQTIYLTLTIQSDSLMEARGRFASMEGALRGAFIQIGVNGMAGSSIIPVGINQRMQIWYNFTHSGTGIKYKYDYYDQMRRRKDFISTVSPGKIDFYNDYFVMNDTVYGKVMYISDYPKSLESDIIDKLSEINCTSYITVNSEILDLTGYKQEIRRKHASVGMKIENEKQANRNRNDFLSDASDKLLGEKNSLIKLARDVDEGDDHYFNSTIMIMFLEKSYEDMNKTAEKIINNASLRSLEVKPCFNMQREGINSTFMFGIQEYKRCCNFSAPCLAMMMPYKTQELNDENGTWYGINQLSQNAIFANKKKLMNYNGMILGKSGSGKSVFAKCEIISTFINNPKDQILIIDPQSEYGPVTDAVGGSTIYFDTQKEVYINPLDVDFEGVDYASLQEIIADKTDFILSLLASCLKRDLDPEEQGILDEVIDKVYSENYAMRRKLNGEGAEVTEYTVPVYMQNNRTQLMITTDLSNEEQIRTYSPLLQDIYQELIDLNQPIALKLAAGMQIFVNGSLNLFNHRTNVDINKRFITFDINSIKDNIRNTAMLVMLEIIRDKIKKNDSLGLWTHLYIDEFHELLGIPAVADYVIKLWKEIRKNHGVLTGITQNMTDLLNNSADAQKLAAILSNTEYFALLNQSTIDRGKLMEFLPSISPAMFNFVEGAERGTGLLKMGNVTVPFDIRINKESTIYKIVQTSEKNLNKKKEKQESLSA